LQVGGAGGDNITVWRWFRRECATTSDSMRNWLQPLAQVEQEEMEGTVGSSMLEQVEELNSNGASSNAGW